MSLLKEEMKYVEEKFSELKFKIDGTYNKMNKFKKMNVFFGQSQKKKVFV